MDSYRDWIANLKDSQSSQSNLSISTASGSTREKPSFPNLPATASSIRKYQNVTSDTENYDLKVMATAASSLYSNRGLVQGSSDQPPQESALQKIQEELTKQAVKSMFVNQQESGTSSDGGSLEHLLVPDAEGRMMLGNLSRRNKRTAQALVTVSSLTEAAFNLETRLQTPSPSQTAAEIHSVLCSIEDGTEVVGHQLASFTQGSISSEVKKVQRILHSVNNSVQEWRLAYPDTSPIKIDNRRYFLDPGEGKNVPTVIAYCLALVSRVFEGTAQRGATLILKLMKMFGYSLATLGGRALNSQQEAALATIPESIQTLEKKFNLDIDCIPYALCPACNCTYRPSYPNGSTDPVYPTTCMEKNAPWEEPCGASLLESGKPIKICEYYPFFDWFGKFIALPGIEEYGDQFCKTIDSHRSIPSDKVDATDGSFVHTFCGADGRRFVADRGTEGRWYFNLSADFFNVEGNRLRGKTASTGIISMNPLNLPLEMRNDSAYRYVPLLIQGPHEPNAIKAEHRHFLKPLVDDLLVGYTRGVRPYATFNTRHNDSPYSRAFQLALASIIMDFKAARPFAGFLDVTSHHFCYICDCWHVAHLGRTDYENWQTVDNEFLKKGAQLWHEAANSATRSGIEKLYGTRYSELGRLFYLKPSCQIGPEPMHTSFLILPQRFFREILGLDNPGSPDHQPEKPKFRFAFYHDFIPPPPLSALAANTAEMQTRALRKWKNIVGFDLQPEEDHRLSILAWPHLSPQHHTLRQTRLESLGAQIIDNDRAFQDVLEIIQDLSNKAPTLSSEKKQWYGKIQKQNWHAILFVCDNLAIFPNSNYPHLQNQLQITKKDITRGTMTNLLLDWRISGILEAQEFTWPHFTPTNLVPPIASWAPRNASQDTSTVNRHFEPHEQQDLLKGLTSVMKYHSASEIGKIHRLLQEPIARDEDKDKLRISLKRNNGDALAYVCIDLDRLPSGKFSKDNMVKQLMVWRMSKPLEEMQKMQIDSSSLLQAVQKVVRETITPSWMAKPPANIGLKEAGTIKADLWRTLFRVHVPLAIISQGKESSPLAASDAHSMTAVVDMTMHLACALIIMTKRTLNVERRNLFRQLLRLHIQGLKQHFPGHIWPSHHLAFHIFDFMEHFSGVRHWWAFPFENLIGRLQRIPTNHKTGVFEHTLLHSFNKGASFRQWLMRPNAPPILRYCQQLLDEAYNYDHTPSPPPPPIFSQDDVDNEFPGDSTPPEILANSFSQSASKYKIKTPTELLNLLGAEPYECFSRISGLQGDYAIPSEGALGNSFICFNPEGVYQPGQHWQAGQIRYIFKQKENGPVQVALYRSQLASTPDPFHGYWDIGFEAKMVSSEFSRTLEIINLDQIAAHTARWVITDRLSVVVSLCSD